MKEQELKNLKEYFNQVNIHSNLKIETLGFKNLTSIEKFDITNFKVKYQILQILNFSNKKLIEETIKIGEQIVNLKK